MFVWVNLMSEHAVMRYNKNNALERGCDTIYERDYDNYCFEI